VRDFGIATSRKFILDAMAVQLVNKTVMAISVYPKVIHFGETSTRTVAHTLKVIQLILLIILIQAVSVSAEDQGMEYMICWNYGRPDEKELSERTKNGMIGVVIHEVGHNFFPMIVNSDERQWSWMDEGLNTFMQYMAEQNEQNFPSSRTCK
jgi:hypothetical protein